MQAAPRPNTMKAITPYRYEGKHSFDPVQGRQNGSDPHDDHIQVRWTHPHDDPTQGQEIGSHPYDDPTQGRQIGSHPYDDPTRTP